MASSYLQCYLNPFGLEGISTALRGKYLKVPFSHCVQRDGNLYLETVLTRNRHMDLINCLLGCFPSHICMAASLIINQRVIINKHVTFVLLVKQDRLSVQQHINM